MAGDGPPGFEDDLVLPPFQSLFEGGGVVGRFGGLFVGVADPQAPAEVQVADRDAVAFEAVR